MFPILFQELPSQLWYTHHKYLSNDGNKYHMKTTLLVELKQHSTNQRPKAEYILHKDENYTAHPDQEVSYRKLKHLTRKKANVFLLRTYKNDYTMFQFHRMLEYLLINEAESYYFFYPRYFDDIFCMMFYYNIGIISKFKKIYNLFTIPISQESIRKLTLFSLWDSIGLC